MAIEGLHERTEYRYISFFLPIAQLCSVSDVLFTGGRGVSDFSVFTSDFLSFLVVELIQFFHGALQLCFHS